MISRIGCALISMHKILSLLARYLVFNNKPVCLHQVVAISIFNLCLWISVILCEGVLNSLILQPAMQLGLGER